MRVPFRSQNANAAQTAAAPGSKTDRCLRSLWAGVRPFVKLLFGPLKRKCEAEIFWIRRRVLFSRDLSQVLDIRPGVPVQFRKASLGDFDSLNAADHDYPDAQKLAARARLAAGDEVYLGMLDDRTIFYGWIMFGQMDMNLERYVPISPDRVYSYKLFTVEKFRGRRVLSAYFSFLFRDLAARNYRQAISQVRANNHPSIAAHRKNGFQTLGSFWEFQVGSRQYCFMNRRLRQHLLRPLPTVAR
jgi:L-amino acid N-acyltransferase YncA